MPGLTDKTTLNQKMTRKSDNNRMLKKPSSPKKRTGAGRTKSASSQDSASAFVSDASDVKALEPEVLDPEVDNEPEVIPADVDLPIEDDSDSELGLEDPLESKSTSIVRYDPLDAYLRELRTYPHLSREEEHALAVRYKDSEDVKAAYKLVTSNLWLVVKIAKDYERAARSVLDLIQEGNIGLMEAVKNFDPYRGVRFPSYAVWWVKAYIVRYLIANWRLVKLGTTQAQRKLFFNLKKEQEKLEREGFYAAPKLLAQRLNVKESEVVEMQQRLEGSDVSVDAPLQPSDSDTNLLSILPSQGDGLEELLDRKKLGDMFQASIAEFLESASEKEKVVFKSRLLSEDKVTLHDVALELDLSKERVRQIENQLRDKFKKFLEDKFGEDVRQFIP